MDFERITQLIKSMIPFKQEEFDLYAQKLRMVEVKKNEIWEPEGRIAKYLGFLNKGMMRLYYTKDGQEYTEQFFSEGEFLGNFISYLKQQPALRSIQALEDCELLVLTFDEQQALYDKVPISERFGRLVAEKKLLDLHDRTSSLLLDSPEERYHKLMAAKPDLHQRVPQYLIAQYLGIRPESLSRIRKRSHETIRS